MIVQQVNEVQWSKYMHGTLVRVHVHYVQKIFDINTLDFLHVQCISDNFYISFWTKLVAKLCWDSY